MKEVDLIESWIKKKTILKESSIRLYISQIACHYATLNEAISNDNVDLINDLLIREWRRKNSNSKKPAFILFLKFKQKHKMIFDLVKLKGKPRKNMPKWISLNKVSMIIENIVNIKLKLILMLLRDTSARVREIIQLKTKDIENQMMMITTKTGKTKIIKIPTNTYKRLIDYIDRYVVSDYVFLDKKIDLDFETSIRSEYNRLLEKLKSVSNQTIGEKISFHVIRRSTLQEIIRKDNSINGLFKAQKKAGHSSTATTLIYLRELCLFD